jgi:hypothetical protein
MRVAGLALMIVCLAACGAEVSDSRGIPSYTPGPTTPGATFSFNADKGAHPVSYRSGVWSSPPNEFMIDERDNVVRIDVESGTDDIRIELGAPARVPIEAGRYPGARNIAHFPDSPGMQVISRGLGCDDDYGEFVVDKIERDGGTLVALDAGFVQSCGGADEPALRGRVHYHR